MNSPDKELNANQITEIVALIQRIADGERSYARECRVKALSSSIADWFEGKAIAGEGHVLTLDNLLDDTFRYRVKVETV